MSAPRQLHAWVVTLVIAAWTALITLPGLASPGFVLANDSVAVPDQPLLPWMWGAGTAPPRSVPQDALVAVLDNIVPGMLLQRLLIVAPLALLGLGVARLLHGQSLTAQVAAATVAMWSTFVYERMAMGHWGLLLGVAVLPWVLRATADARAGIAGAGARAVLWAALGSLVPSGGTLQLAAVAAVLVWPGAWDRRRSILTALGVVAVQAVWVVPAVLRPGDSEAVAADVFGLRAEGPAGPVLTALATGGIWNAGAAPPSRSAWMSVVAPLMLLVLAVLGASDVRGLRRTVVGPLLLLGGLGLVWALATAIPGLHGLVSAIQGLPGGGLLRDAHKWLAPWSLLIALAAGLGLARLAGLARAHDAAVPAAVLAVVVPLLLLPDLAFGLGGRIAPARYPPEWEQVRATLAGAGAPGDVVSLPWSTFRAYPWNGGRPVLDPAPRYLPRAVVADARLIVSGAGALSVVDADDPRVQQVAEALRSDDPPARLAASGIGYLLVQRDQPGTPGYPAALDPVLVAASVPVVSTQGLELRRLGAAPASGALPSWPWGIAWGLWAAVLLASAGMSVRHYRETRWHQSRLGRRGGASLPGTERR